jgi:hypothetical protein
MGPEGEIYTQRDVFCTTETREIKEDILKILSTYPITRNGMNMVLTLSPSLDKEELKMRFRDVAEVMKLRDSMREREEKDDVKMKRLQEKILELPSMRQDPEL